MTSRADSGMDWPTPGIGRQLRILHVIPSVTFRDGGPSVAVRAMAHAAHDLGADVTIATTNADRYQRLPVRLGIPVDDNGVTFRYFNSAAGGWRFSWGLTRFLMDRASDYDVVHIHALFSYPTIPACRIAARNGVPYVLRPLGTLDRAALQRNRWKKWPYYRLVERAHLLRASAVHVTSESEARDVSYQGVRPERIHLIPHGVADAPVRRLSVRDSGRPARLLFLSRLHPVKGIRELLQAIALTKARGTPVELILAGAGTLAYESELRALVGSLGLASEVTFVGHVDREERGRLYEESDAFILPSLHENFGLAAVEAMAAGLPVILSEGVAIAGLVRDAGAGLLTVREPQAIAEAIMDLLHADPPVRLVMGERGRALVRWQFSMEAMSRRLMTMYQSLANAQPVT